MTILMDFDARFGILGGDSYLLDIIIMVQERHKENYLQCVFVLFS